MVTPFNQGAPELGNQYEAGRVLCSYLRRMLPAEVAAETGPRLRELGELPGGELYRMQLADRLNAPRLVQWDASSSRRLQLFGTER